MLRVECITVCVGYGDFLAQTLPENLPLVDNLVVITSPGDKETQALCRVHNVRHIEVTDEIDRRVVHLEIPDADEELVARLSDAEFVIGVKWRR